MNDHGLPPNSIAGLKVIKEYMFGVVIDPLPGDERFEGWLSIPYLTSQGIKAIKFRNLLPTWQEATPKNGQATGQTVRLFNPIAAQAADDVLGIAEGEIDAVVATERLGLPTVGVPGSQMWIAHQNVWAPAFKNVSRVFVLRDGDDAGKALADAITDTLRLKARVIDMPAGEDVSSMVFAGRAKELLKQLEEDDDDED